MDSSRAQNSVPIGVWLTKRGGTYWDPAPDGKRLLMVTPAESAEAPKQVHEIVMLENFFDELRRRVPVGI